MYNIDESIFIIGKFEGSKEAPCKREAKNPWKKRICSYSILNEEDLDPEDNIETQDKRIADCMSFNAKVHRAFYLVMHRVKAAREYIFI